LSARRAMPRALAAASSLGLAARSSLYSTPLLASTSARCASRSCRGARKARQWALKRARAQPLQAHRLLRLCGVHAALTQRSCQIRLLLAHPAAWRVSAGTASLDLGPEAVNAPLLAALLLRQLAPSSLKTRRLLARKLLLALLQLKAQHGFGV